MLATSSGMYETSNLLSKGPKVENDGMECKAVFRPISAIKFISKFYLWKNVFKYIIFHNFLD